MTNALFHIGALLFLFFSTGTLVFAVFQCNINKIKSARRDVKKRRAAEQDAAWIFSSHEKETSQVCQMIEKQTGRMNLRISEQFYFGHPPERMEVNPPPSLSGIINRRKKENRKDAGYSFGI